MPHRSSTYSAVINATSNGDNTIISAPASGPINVYGIILTVSGATNLTFKDGTTALSGAIVLTANGSSVTLPLSDEPWFQIQPGDNFIINQSGNATMAGTIWYTIG
jgi:hypothetical protein